VAVTDPDQALADDNGVGFTMLMFLATQFAGPLGEDKKHLSAPKSAVVRQAGHAGLVVRRG
jgi:hypothetical protein